MSNMVSTSRDLKRSNRSHLLNLLYFNEPTTRLDLSHLSGLSPATVTKIIGELIAENIVIEIGVEDSHGGRPRTTLRINHQYGCFIGVDVGETHVYVELFDVKLNSVSDIKFALKSNEILPQDITTLIVDGVRTLQASSNIRDETVLGVGIGVPGIVDRSGGVSIFAPNWGWRNVALLRLLQHELNLPILLDNGAQAMALAETWFGAGKGLKNLAVLLIGTGIGSGMIADGKLYRGTSNSAGEWGHTCIDPNGPPCRCGSRGCVEAFAGARAIVEHLRVSSPESPILNCETQVDMIRALRDAATAGDVAALEVLDRVGQKLGVGIANLVNLFNPQMIVIGGWSGTMLGGLMLPRIQQTVQQYALAQPMANTGITLSRLGWDAVSLGAATLALQAFLLGENGTIRQKGRQAAHSE